MTVRPYVSFKLRWRKTCWKLSIFILDDSYNTESPSNDQTLLLHDRQVPILGRRQVGSLDDPGGGVDRSDEGSVEASAGAGGDGLVSVRVVQTPARTLQADLATMGINVEIANVEVSIFDFLLHLIDCASV